MPPERVVVVGGGVAGVSTVTALRRLGHHGPLVLLEAGGPPHDRTPLSKGYLQGTTGEDDVRLYPGAWYAEHDVELRTGVRADRLHPDRAVLDLGDGSELGYDALVLAQGATARALPVPGGTAALTLRTLDDARRLRPRLRPGHHLVVVGAGLIGAEVSATAVGLGLRVGLVDPDPLPLAAAVGTTVARVLHADHARHGVEVLRAGVVELVAEGERTRVVLDDGRGVVADAVLSATGLRSSDDLARGAGLDVSADGGALVDEAQRTSAPGVLAVGDGAARRRPDGTAAPAAGHWDAARLDGETAAAVLLGQDPPARPAPWFWTDRYGRHVEVVGEPTAGGAREVRRGEPGDGPFAVLAWRDGHLVGAVSVDEPRVARAARRLVERRTPVDADALADPAADLRALARG